MNDSLFFTVDIDEGDIKVGSTAKVVVRLKFEAIQQNRRLFLKEKYIEEHLTVYSLHPRRYTERCFVAIRLMLGHLPSDLFYTSPGMCIPSAQRAEGNQANDVTVCSSLLVTQVPRTPIHL